MLYGRRREARYDKGLGRVKLPKQRELPQIIMLGTGIRFRGEDWGA